jgi:omega-6 fatty acid desaturase (delta-12 desaturase)
MATNAAIAALLVAAMWLVGVRPFLLVHLPIVILAASIGLAVLHPAPVRGHILG